MDSPPNPPNRILSIDVFRGLTMFLLIGGFTGLYSYIAEGAVDGSIIFAIGEQLRHPEWNGLTFWDLVQPFFMFIVGLSLPFAVRIRLNKGEIPVQISRHVLKRSVTLLIMGWALYCIGAGKIGFRFQNVLSQIAFTYLIAYMIMNRSFRFQALFSIALLLLTEVLYRFFSIDGFDHAFAANQNFGTWLDLQYGGADLKGHWVSINALPTAAHTIWGVLTGKLLMSDKPDGAKFRQLFITGILLVILGYVMDPFTPIIKRIATSSFVIVSGGWSIVTIALLFWIIDIRKKSGSWTLFFSVVGMNSLFIYLFSHVGGDNLIERILHPFTFALFSWGGENLAEIVTAFLVWMGLWGLCFWMYKKRLFIKI